MKLLKFKLFAILPLSLLLLNAKSHAQENIAKNYRIKYSFTTFKKSDNTRLLKVEFTATDKKDRKNKLPIYGAEINFTNFNDLAENSLGKVTTDKNGIAKLVLSDSTTFIKDENGNINFEAVFKKTEALKKNSETISIKDLFLNLELAEIDSVKTVILNAHTIDSINVKNAVEKLDVKFYVEGMLSNLPIEEGTLEDGQYKFKFPQNISGNTDGMVTIIAKVEDHDDFGNVETSKKAQWGTFKNNIDKNSNTLWSEAAPIWMYIVLSILLIGVWANYAYSVVNLFKIKKEGITFDNETNENQ